MFTDSPITDHLSPITDHRFTLEELTLLTVKDVAARLKVCQTTVEKLVAKGHIESSVLPGTERTRRITPNQLKRYIAKMEGESL